MQMLTAVLSLAALGDPPTFIYPLEPNRQISQDEHLDIIEYR